MKESILLLTGRIRLLAPALIGSGRSDYTEMDVILDSDGRPFIPATSLVGVLKHRVQLHESYHRKLDSFWGFSSDNDGRQSALCCSDLDCLSDDVKISTRDGIAIDSASGMVKNEAKYDYQVIEPYAEFKLRMEVIVKKNDDVDFFINMMNTIIELLKEGRISIGAKTNNGYGKVHLMEEGLFHVDFTEKDHVKKWFMFTTGASDDVTNLPRINGNTSLMNKIVHEPVFSIEAGFKLTNSLIIRSYPDHPEAPDAVNIKSQGNAVIPGSSLRGALRGRAERILNTLEIPAADVLLKNLFGYADETSQIKGKLMIEETILPDFPEELQPRIKIDRFTGGTVAGALFDSMPLFNEQNNDDKTIILKLTITGYDDHEAGLLMLLLKDLWTGDLAVGGEKNIGRGVFKGCGAMISLHGHPGNIELPGDVSHWKDEHKEVLQKLVDQLINFKATEEHNEH